MNTAEKLIKLASKLSRRQISSICSLCIVGVIAATIAGFSQVGTTTAPVIPVAAAPAPTVDASGVSLPVDRTLTSTDGRTINVTILEKTATGIKATLNGKTFNIELSTLSVADKDFIESCKAPVAIGKKLIYVINKILPADLENIELLRKEGYDVTLGYEPKEKVDKINVYGADNPASKNARNIYTARNFDVYWRAIPGYPGSEKKMPSDDESLESLTFYGEMLESDRIVIICSCQQRPRKWYTGNRVGVITWGGIAPIYIKADRNLISYNNQLPDFEIDGTILPQIIEKLKKSQK